MFQAFSLLRAHRLAAVATLAVIGAVASPAQAAQLYVTQGFVDYAINGAGVRAQNASNIASCSGTSDAAFFAQPSTFSVVLPAGSTVDRAYLFWGGSITNAGNADATVTAVFNGVTSTVTGTTQTGTSSLGYTYYKGTADVTAALAAAAPTGGTVTVSVSNFTLNASPAKDACGAAGGATLVVVHTTDPNGAGVEPRAVAIDDVTTVLFQATQTGNVTGLAGASSTPNARMSAALMEGDVAVTGSEAFSFAGTSYDASVNWDEGDRNLIGGEGNSWEIDTITVTIAAGATSAAYAMQTGQDTILPVVLAVSWNVRSEYGDAPASYGVARHTPANLGSGATRLGAGIDFEGGSQHDVNANGDDANGTDDDSGVTSLALLTVADTSYSVTTECSGGTNGPTQLTGRISGWIDFDRSGAFDADERAQATCPPGATTATLTWTIAPTRIVAGPSFLRLRIAATAADVANPTGNALTGEVEDFKLDIVPTLAVTKQVWPDADTGVFDFRIDSTTIGTNVGDDQTLASRTLYHKPINNYNGMTGIAPSVTVVLDVSATALVFTLSEVGGAGTNLADYTSAYTCANGAGTTVASANPGASAALTIPLSTPGASPNGRQQNITCAFTNSTTRITVVKNTQLGNGAFDFTATGNRAATFQVTTAGGTGSNASALARVNPVTPGTTETITETVPAGWRLESIACTSLSPAGATATVGTVSGSGITVPLQSGHDITCTWLNHKLTADVRLTKTNTPGVNADADQPGDAVVSGAPSSYAITVTNAGPDAADGALIADPAPTGLVCPTASCAAGGGASCPAATGAALVSALQAGGVAIPLLPVGGSVTLTLSCTVQ